jgi:hypothetical protein
MALEINGVVYTGMDTVGCLHWHMESGFRLAWELYTFSTSMRFRNI